MQKVLEIGLMNAALASVLALAAFLIGRACRRPVITHTLWLLVLLKLLTPPLVSVPLPWPSSLGALVASTEGPPTKDPPLAREKLLTEEVDILLADDFSDDQESVLA